MPDTVDFSCAFLSEEDHTWSYSPRKSELELISCCCRLQNSLKKPTSVQKFAFTSTLVLPIVQLNMVIGPFFIAADEHWNIFLLT